MRTNKKGISLIVLVLTIIVMIILATAIILSISNSGIMNKANKAKNDNDATNIKEYVNVLKAEWDLMTETERAGQKKEEYVNVKLEEKGYTGALLMDDGTLYTNLQANAKEALKDGIKIGDKVLGYTLDDSADKKTYDTSGNENTAPNREVGTEHGVEQEATPQLDIKRIEYNENEWMYIGISDDGEVLIAPNMITTTIEDKQKITLSGKGGFLNGPKELNDMCAAMYSTDRGTARSMNIDDINRILDYTGDKSSYYDINGNFVTTKVAKKISDISASLRGQTPAGTIGDYYLDAYTISQTSDDILKSLNTGKDEDTAKKNLLLNFVYIENTYFLASSCVQVNFSGGYVGFSVFFVKFTGVGYVNTFGSGGQTWPTSLVVRPVVSLKSNIQLKEQDDDSWKLN